ncbi:protein GYP6 [Kluyveromyces marxianus]|uniref:Protein GYP6 n=1 Tax=Kluyveromyces marxianus TaxID=4911 RepID=A0ABX6ET66_KLUMA|nr:protein GYP6 [Kluyveromyces marxianus]
MVVGHRDRVEQEEHPLAVVNGVSMMENRELIRLDVSRLQWPDKDNGPAAEAVQEILYGWVRTSGLEYKQGMHELCLAVYVEAAGSRSRSDVMFREMMEWLYPLFYADGAVSRWIDAELMQCVRPAAAAGPLPLLHSLPLRRVAALLERYSGSHEVWCVRWCRLLFMRELAGPQEYWPVWRAVMRADASARGRVVACVAVVLMVCVLPELCAAQDESEWLGVLLHYPGLRGVSVDDIVLWAAELGAQRQEVPEVPEVGPPVLTLEDRILQQTNREWYAKHKDSDISRIRMEARLQRRVNWRLHQTGLK